MRYLLMILFTIVVFIFGNFPIFYDIYPNIWLFLSLSLIFIFLNIMPIFYKNIISKRLKICLSGVHLIIMFLGSAFMSTGFLILELMDVFKTNPSLWFFDLAIVIITHSILFWNGIIRIYCTSIQLGIKYRIIGVLCGLLPIINLIVLGKLVYIVHKEIWFENEKDILNETRKSKQICATKYPILMVHGVFFRDYRYLNYWGRIPKELEKNGAKIFYGNHQSAASVANSAKELKARIISILEETKTDKVNIIAHSKGGLDSRYAISMLGMNQYVASLTTINTPHRGCVFGDYLLDHIHSNIKDKVAHTYNATLKKMGDHDPDFIEAVNDLTASACIDFNKTVLDKREVYYQSVGSKLNHATNGKFPLNFSFPLVKYFDGDNDGLVSTTSFEWGDEYHFVSTNGKRGISHGDMIDLNRENIDRFDVREFYVQLVSELKQKGY